MANAKDVLEKRLAVNLTMREKIIAVIDSMAEEAGVSKGVMIEHLLATHQDYNEEVALELLGQKEKRDDHA